MASGIDWFRWHHGSVTDPKFQLVAKKSGSTLPDVLAVWTYLLEKASAAEFRGCFGETDCESVDCLFGFDDGKTESIMLQMVERKLIADEFIVAWEKRQVKRERESDNSSDRVKAFREKQRHVTPSNANDAQETPREEESREEKKEQTLVASKLAQCPHQEILSIFSEELPDLPQPRVWDGKRADAMLARWRWVLADLKKKAKPHDKDAGLEFFRRMFAYISKSDFLMGRKTDWTCSLPWIVEAENFAKIIEGNFEPKEAA